MKTNSNSRKSSLKLVVCDAAIVAYATYFSSLALGWLGLDLNTDATSMVITCVAFAVSVTTINLSVGLYESSLREPFRGIIRRIFVSAIISFFVVTIATNALYRPYEAHPLLAPLSVTLIIMTLVAFRYFVYNTESLSNKPNIVVLGTGVRASVIEKRMRRMVDRSNFNLVSFIPVSGDQRDEGIEKEKVANIELNEDFDKYLKDQEINEIIIANDQRRGTLPIDSLFNARLQGVQVTDLLDFMERETGQIAVDLMYPSWVIYSNGFQSQKIFRTVMDYWLNIFLAIFVLFFTWPIMLITALIIYVDDGYRTGASVLYKQQRVGKNGKLFNILKFRSMRPDAEKDGAKWASKNDNRVTSIGAFIRKYRVDELPQLINVLRGEMSFIGPRPERPEFVEQLVEELPYFNQRHNVKPGLAGWAQLNYPYGASVKDSLEKLKFDLYYVKHQSLLLDLLILIRTVEVILFGKGR
ncbi:TIGR03013 family XrtA/PEP-CTERM system glycosyltransferase [Glaciecola petra]|uniref:TIGR03013 family PEP-CTERM/XrtA system glycosyltransferase n=1 Tax=Glaciecola petra TaxID=3075602 RepID=A0ABU2ZLU9_9ALTE|nr:TIGR03013 family XrtA/PEP-CTERM system glycosyltransferase [Aestuariibacter sp. P117]MDT0593597.1 TIGR03013 family PEP-CTERM/XrtA system glycosyltransferase [Aestuariibacter sp. P117]